MYHNKGYNSHFSIQGLIARQSLLTKGPLALFFGGEEIIPYLSSKSTTLKNVPIFFLIGLSVLLHIFLTIYKIYKFRKEIQREQQLNQVMMSGFRNVFGQTVVVLDILVICVVILVHLYLSNQAKKVTQVPIGHALILAFLLIFVSLHHFVRNIKLRFVSSQCLTKFDHQSIFLGVSPRRRF